MTKFKLNRVKYVAAALLLVLANFAFYTYHANKANAAQLNSTYIRLNRMKSGTGTTFRLQFKAVSTQTAQVVIDFNGTDSGTSQWTNATPGGLVNTTQTVTTAACVTDTGDTALPGAPT